MGQYVSLFDKFYLIDCPGTVYPRPGDTMVSAILRSVIRVQNVESPEEYVREIISRTRKEYLQRMYEIEDWNNSFDFMAQIALKTGKLLKGGESDYHNVSVAILFDWQRGKIPWFICPSFEDDLEYEYKLRNEQKRIEEELRMFTEDKEIEYEPIDTTKTNENNGDDVIKENGLITHDFEQHDLDETEYRNDVQMKGKEDEDEEAKILDAMTSDEREKFDKMK